MSKVIKLDHLTKIEGHAHLHIKIDNGKVKRCELGSIEGSRYFEGMLKGRSFEEAPEITSRICGICSCAHTVCSIMAMEKALGITPSRQSVYLRELMMIGERIRSHAAHLYFLALPDYLGFDSALDMVPTKKKAVQGALQLVKLGNEIVTVIGGREMHPVSAQIGGFMALPQQDSIKALLAMLMQNRVYAHKTAELFISLPYPDFENKTEYFSLSANNIYPLMYGSLLSETHQFEQPEYGNFLHEYHEPYSTANFVVKGDKPYMVGALARINNSHTMLGKEAQGFVKKSKISFPSFNPFHNNIAQAIEIVHYLYEAIRLCRKLGIKDEPVPQPKARKGHGIAAIEVPRGILWHEYAVNDHGRIEHANIITPTCQNLLNMQTDVRAYLGHLLKKNKDEIVLEIEKLIRAYDPCFSCSSHFLEVTWE